MENLSKIVVSIQASSNGTGFFIGENLIITANHVIKDSPEIFVRTPKNELKQYKAKIVIQLPNIDIAILKLFRNQKNDFVAISPYKELEKHYFQISGSPSRTDNTRIKQSGQIKSTCKINSDDFCGIAFQLDPDNKELDPDGLSGAPVFIPFIGGVAAVFAGYYPNTGIHYAIPIYRVIELLPSSVLNKIDINLLPIAKSTNLHSNYNKKTFVSLSNENPFLKKVNNSNAQIILLKGPSGSGKSSYASYWADTTRRKGKIVIWGETFGDIGINFLETNSIIQFFFNHIYRKTGIVQEIIQDNFFEQFSNASIFLNSLKLTENHQICFIIDGIENISDKKTFFSRLLNDLRKLKQFNIIPYVICCERTELSTISFPIENLSDITYTEITLNYLEKNEAEKIYEQGYRIKNFPWLPAFNELPSKVMSLLRLPLYIDFIVKLINDNGNSAISQSVNIIGKVINSIINKSISVLNDGNDNIITKSNITKLVWIALEKIVGEMTFSHPPKIYVRYGDINDEISLQIKELNLEGTIGDPNNLYSCLSKSGLLILTENYLLFTFDFFYEYLLCSYILNTYLLEENVFDEEFENKCIFTLLQKSNNLKFPDSFSKIINYLLIFPPSIISYSIKHLVEIIREKSEINERSFLISFDTFLLDIIKNYNLSEPIEEFNVELTLYKDISILLHDYVPEQIIAFPYIAIEKDNEVFLQTVNIEDDIRISRMKDWITMRRAISLLYLRSLSSNYLTLQLIALLNHGLFNKFDENKMPTMKRLALLSYNILKAKPHLLDAIYGLNFENQAISLFLMIVKSREDLNSLDNKIVVWEKWMDITISNILFDVLASFNKASSQNPSEQRFSMESYYLGRKAFLNSGELFQKVTQKILKDKNILFRSNLLLFLEALLKMEENNSTKETLELFSNLGLPFTLWWNSSPEIRKELLIHSNRPSIGKKEKVRAIEIAKKLWDGAMPDQKLSNDFNIRIHQLNQTISHHINTPNTPILDVLSHLRADIESNKDLYLRALDSIVVCLSILSLEPKYFPITWQKFNEFIILIDEIAELKDLIQIISSPNDDRKGQKFEALNLLIIPLDDEERHSKEFRKCVIEVDRWAKSQARFPEEKKLVETFRVIKDFLNRRDFISAIKSCQKLIDYKELDFFIKAQSYIRLAHAYMGLEDLKNAYETIINLEVYLSNLTNNNSYGFLLDLNNIESLKPRVQNILSNIRNQIRNLLWSARELKSKILDKQSDSSGSVLELVKNFNEAIQLKAWWPAFRGLAKLCDVLINLKNYDLAFQLCGELENCSDDIQPILLGKMQRAVLLYYARTEIKESINLIDEIIPEVPKLSKKIPEKEIEGIFLWLKSTRAWAYRDLEMNNEAIEASKEVLEESIKIDSPKDISGAYELLRSCYLSADKKTAAIMTAKDRYEYCISQEPQLTENAADSAYSIVKQIINDKQIEIENKKNYILSWIEIAKDLYTKLNNSQKLTDLEQYFVEINNDRK